MWWGWGLGCSWFGYQWEGRLNLPLLPAKRLGLVVPEVRAWTVTWPPSKSEFKLFQLKSLAVPEDNNVKHRAAGVPGRRAYAKNQGATLLVCLPRLVKPARKTACCEKSGGTGSVEERRGPDL